MVTYSVGTKVVHPTHGAGTIVAIENKSLGEQSRRYYIIDTMAAGEPTRTRQLMVPVSRAENSGLRCAAPASRLRDMLYRCVPPQENEIDRDYRTRQVAIGEMLNSGSFARVAEAVATLYVLHTMRPLGITDRRLFEHGKDILASEIAVATGSEMDGALREVEDWMADHCRPDEEEETDQDEDA